MMHRYPWSTVYLLICVSLILVLEVYEFAHG